MKRYFLQILPLLLFMITIISGIISILHAANTPSIVLEKVRLTHYFPNATFTQAVDYTPFVIISSLISANILWFIINLFLIEPQRVPMNNAHEIPSLLGSSLQPLEHLSDTLEVVPNVNPEKLQEELIAQGVQFQAPATHPSTPIMKEGA